LIAEHAENPEEVSVGIETDHGLWVTSLVAAGYRVYAINPKAVARYRDRHHVGGGKSDAGDAKVLADLVRTDAHNHRVVAGDSDHVQAVKVLARAQQATGVVPHPREQPVTERVAGVLSLPRWRRSRTCTTATPSRS
jgi:hypothetical protein